MDSWPKCVPCTLVPPEWPPFPGRDSTADARVMPKQLYHAHQALVLLVELVLPAGEGLMGNRHCGKGFLVESHSTTRRLLWGERPIKVLLVAEVSSTGGEWAHVGHAHNSSTLHHTVSLVSIHQSLRFPLPPSCQGRSGCNGASCFCVSDVFIYASQICHMMERKFGEGLHFLKVFNLQAQGSGQMRVILSAESS